MKEIQFFHGSLNCIIQKRIGPTLDRELAQIPARSRNQNSRSSSLVLTNAVAFPSYCSSSLILTTAVSSFLPSLSGGPSQIRLGSGSAIQVNLTGPARAAGFQMHLGAF